MQRHDSIHAMHDEQEKVDINVATETTSEKDRLNPDDDTNDDKKKEKENLTFKQKYFPWIVCATSFVVQFFVLGFYKSFGPVYVKLLEPEPEGYGGSPLATSWVASLSISTSYLSTPIAFEVIRRIKFRPAMLLGACLSGLGLLISSFADSVYILYVTFGLLFGMGSSLCYSCSLLILPRYHTTYWALAHGIALAGNGAGGLGLSPANGALLRAVGIKTGFRIMAAVSFGVLFTCGLIYDTPPEPTDEELDDEDFDNEDFEDEDNEEEEDDDEKMNDLNQFYYFHETIWKNKPLLVFLLSTYLLNFGYYVPYVHLVKLSLDVGVSKERADLLPGILSISQSVGKIFIGKVFSYEGVNKIRAYQLSLIALSIATTFVPVLKTYVGLVVYAVAFGFSDGCGQATNMIIIGELTGKKLLPKGYSTFLVCSASAFVVGPPIAGFVYSSTGEYSIAFFMCGAMAFASAILLFVVTCMRDEEQVEYRKKLRVQRAEAKKKAEEKKKREAERPRDSGIDIGAAEAATVSIQTPRSLLLEERKRRLRQSQDSFNRAMLTRSWHSIDFKPHKSKSRESLRSRTSRKTMMDMTELKAHT